MKYRITGFLLVLFIVAGLFAEETTSKRILTVEDAVALAMDENVSVQRQALALDLLKEKSLYSWNSVSPSMNVSGSYNQSLGQNDSSSWSVSGSVNVSLTPALYTSIKNARLNYENGQLSFEQTKRTVEVNVRKLFLNLLLSKQSLELQKKNLETARQRYNSNREKFSRGQLSELDLLNSQYNYESLKPAVESAEINYENSLLSFKIFLGLPEEAEIELKGNLNDYVTKKEISFEYNIEEIPSIITLERQLEVAKINLLAARFSAYGPSFSAGYTYSQSGRSNVNGTQESNSLNFSVRLPLDGLLPWSTSSVNIDSIKTNVKDLELQLKNEKANTKLNIETSLKKIKQAQSQLELLESNVTLAQKTYNVTLTAYNHGSKDYLTLQNASVSLLNAQLGLEQQRYNLISAVLDLENTLGLEFGELGK
jgi:outer membrane protein TolC